MDKKETHNSEIVDRINNNLREGEATIVSAVNKDHITIDIVLAKENDIIMSG